MATFILRSIHLFPLLLIRLCLLSPYLHFIFVHTNETVNSFGIARAYYLYTYYSSSIIAKPTNIKWQISEFNQKQSVHTRLMRQDGKNEMKRNTLRKERERERGSTHTNKYHWRKNNSRSKSSVFDISQDWRDDISSVCMCAQYYNAFRYEINTGKKRLKQYK